MLHKTEGIVLHYIKYGETSIIAHVYTRDFGKQSYLVQGVRKRKAKLSRNIFYPLMTINMEVYHKDKRELQRIKEADPAFYFNTIPFDIKKSTIAVFIAEILYRSLKEETSNNTLFDFLKNAIQILDTKNDRFTLFHHLFLVQLTKYLGFFPNCSDDNNALFFDMRDGLFRQTPPLHHDYLNPELGNAFKTLIMGTFKNIDHLNINKDMQGKILNKILEYYDLHNISIGKAKSYQVLKEVFND